MNVENLKQGDKVILFKIDTLVKKGEIKTEGRETPISSDKKTLISQEMVNDWGKEITIFRTKLSDFGSIDVLFPRSVPTLRIRPSWIRRRINKQS